MAVDRIWFPNAPSGNIDEQQREQIICGLYISSFVPVIAYLSYIRSYLGDSNAVIVQGSAPTIATSTTSSYLTYLRSYLGDS